MKEYKILLTGTMGAGKTTAIAAISDVPPVSTDVLNTDASTDKATTTVGYDYGELHLPGGDRLRLYGTPGQQRFAFMWKILAQGALGLVILIDNSRPDPLQDLRDYLQGFAGLIHDTGCVVGVGRMEQCAQPDLDAHAEVLQGFGLLCPVVATDVREREQVALLLDLLMLQLEARQS
ncbi:GTP-binding protein [Ectopseudomonas oleovorans]|uniref:GTP-binding protein n=1 Tax=Ectopseudomonas oleovorans TaxID=301 RepID=UPI0035ADE3CA